MIAFREPANFNYTFRVDGAAASSAAAAGPSSPETEDAAKIIK